MNDQLKKADIFLVMSELAEIIQYCTESIDNYLEHCRERLLLNPLINRPAAGVKEMIHTTAEAFLNGVGVHRIILNEFNGYTNLFKDCRIVEFSDWATTTQASDYWDSLRTEIIHPLGRKNVDFIFTLGDVSKKLVFQTDEILDIIDEYSDSGTVTLMMDEKECRGLSAALNGVGLNLTDTASAGGFIFNTMKINAMILFTTGGTVFFSRKNQFDIHGSRPVTDKCMFNVGYELGLLMDLDMRHCVALGIAVSESFTEAANQPSRKTLLEYLNRWGTNKNQV